jgi:D-glycero-alpha-D-manno-heptose-7-phosphate kinase
MLISRTPFRISFFGGGTDYPAWYLNNGGSVLATTINKYCYVSCRYLPPFFDHRLRAVYSKIENVQSFEELQHPAIREAIRFMGINRGLEIHHDGDLPARSGMGSSSSFTVGMLHALYALKGIMPGKRRLALESIYVEQEMIREMVGSQDQVSAAYGGLNHIVFHTNGDIEVRPLILPLQRRAELLSHLMLFYTGIKRTASDIAKSFVADIESKSGQLKFLGETVDKGIDILTGSRSISQFGELLHESWKAKCSMSSQVTNGVVDEIYARARAAGALGGKVTGAGGGGFLLLFVPPHAQERVRCALKELLYVPFQYDSYGSQIIFYELGGEDYAGVEKQQDRAAITPFRELTSLAKIGDLR